MALTNENLIINGNFDLWQRGISFSIPSTGSGVTFNASATRQISDRWYLIDTQIRASGSTGNIEAYRESFSINDQLFSTSDYYLTVSNQISGSTVGSCYVENKQENANSFANIPVTLSFYAKTLYDGGLTGATMSCYFRQVYNPGITSGQYTSSAESVTVNPYWQKYSATLYPRFMGSLSGEHYFSVGFKLPSRNTVSIAAVKLEVGLNSTILLTDPEEEKKKQEKYYYSTYLLGITSGSSTTTNNNDVSAIEFVTTPYYIHNHKFDIPQYKTPTVTVYSPSSGVSGDAFNRSASTDMRLTSGTRGWNLATRISPTGVSTLTATPSKYGVVFNTVSGAVIFDDILVHMIADADLNPGSTDRGLET